MSQGTNCRRIARRQRRPHAAYGREQGRPIDRVDFVGTQHVYGQSAGSEMPEVVANAALDGAVVRVISVVAALAAANRLPRDHEPEVADIERDT